MTPSSTEVFGGELHEAGMPGDGASVYEPGLYRARITDYGIDSSSDEPALWLEFLPLARLAGLPGDIGCGEPILHGPQCRQFFDVEGGSFDGTHPATPVELLRGIRDICLDVQSYGRARPSDPCGLVGRQVVARCEHRGAGGPNAWSLVPVRHTYPRPGCQCRTCRDWGKRRRRR